MQSGKYALDAREVDLDEILQASIASFHTAAQEAGIEIEGNIASELPAVKGDAAKLRQAFGNLISNAVRFTPHGGRVTVLARALESGGVTVTVRDTGLGMTPEEIAVALTPFAQVDASRSRWREGAGLGLPIARALVQLHGGRLEIKSTKSVGTEVTVSLPPAAEVSNMHGPATAGLVGSSGTA
jgi:two-component system cell cycle sensor histidine kinase PleC